MIMEQFWRMLSAVFVLILGLLFFIYPPYEYIRTLMGPSNHFENEERLSLSCEWFDPIVQSIKKLRLNFYPGDNSIEMYDVQAKKLFLKRMHMPGIDDKNLYLGNTVVVLSRQLKVVAYADDFTEREMTRKRQKTFAMIKPDAVHRVGEIVEMVQNKGFEVGVMKMVRLSRNQAMQFYEEHRGRNFFEDLVSYITSGPVIAMELIGNEAVGHWRKTLGPTDSEVARSQDPETLRAKFGKDKQENAAHGSDSIASASRELEFFFGAKTGNSMDSACRLGNSTCCIIKPHAIRAGNLGKILSGITEGGFEITGLEMFRLRKDQAEEFLEVYDGVLPYYPQMVQQLISGPIVAIEVSGREGVSAPQAFREFVGPMNAEIAKELKPDSLRAKFGEDKVRNAVHCSDLPEDGPLEVEYFFKILQAPR